MFRTPNTTKEMLSVYCLGQMLSHYTSDRDEYCGPWSVGQISKEPKYCIKLLVYQRKINKEQSVIVQPSIAILSSFVARSL